MHTLVLLLVRRTLGVLLCMHTLLHTLHFKHVVTGTEPTLESVAVRMHANRIPHKKSDRQK